MACKPRPLRIARGESPPSSHRRPEPPGTGPEDEPATRDVVHGACHVGLQAGVAVGVTVDQRPELDPEGLLGKGPQHCPGLQDPRSTAGLRRQKMRCRAAPFFVGEIGRAYGHTTERTLPSSCASYLSDSFERDLPRTRANGLGRRLVPASVTLRRPRARRMFVPAGDYPVGVADGLRTSLDGMRRPRPRSTEDLRRRAPTFVGPKRARERRASLMLLVRPRKRCSRASSTARSGRPRSAGGASAGSLPVRWSRAL